MSTTPDKRDLSLFEVEVLLKSTTKANSNSRSYRMWLGIADAKQLLTAIHHDAEQVYLFNVERMFDIQYRDNKVWLSPADKRSFTPCGWFTPSVLQREVDEFSVISTL